jgi:hypothetical protein
MKGFVTLPDNADGEVEGVNMSHSAKDLYS